MFELIILNLQNGQKFNKIFASEFLKNNFIKKAKYSNKIRIVGVFKI